MKSTELTPLKHTVQIRKQIQVDTARYFGLWRSRSMAPYIEGVGLVDDSLEEKVDCLVNLSRLVSVSVM